MFNNERAFTLIEMIIVMLVISVLLLLIIPNLANQSENVNDKGCEALKEIVQTQAEAYYLDKKKKVNDIQTLVSAGYLKENQTSCGDTPITIRNGKVNNNS